MNMIIFFVVELWHTVDFDGGTESVYYVYDYDGHKVCECPYSEHCQDFHSDHYFFDLMNEYPVVWNRFLSFHREKNPTEKSIKQYYSDLKQIFKFDDMRDEYDLKLIDNCDARINMTFEDYKRDTTNFLKDIINKRIIEEFAYFARVGLCKPETVDTANI